VRQFTNVFCSLDPGNFPGADVIIFPMLTVAHARRGATSFTEDSLHLPMPGSNLDRDGRAYLLIVVPACKKMLIVAASKHHRDQDGQKVVEMADSIFGSNRADSIFFHGVADSFGCSHFK
jgi:hypothetical protein